MIFICNGTLEHWERENRSKEKKKKRRSSIQVHEKYFVLNLVWLLFRREGSPVRSCRTNVEWDEMRVIAISLIKYRGASFYQSLSQMTNPGRVFHKQNLSPPLFTVGSSLSFPLFLPPLPFPPLRTTDWPPYLSQRFLGFNCARVQESSHPFSSIDGGDGGLLSWPFTYLLSPSPLLVSFFSSDQTPGLRFNGVFRCRPNPPCPSQKRISGITRSEKVDERLFLEETIFQRIIIIVLSRN